MAECYGECHLCWVSLMLSVTYAECHLCWVLLMLSVTYAECHLCWVSLMLSVTDAACHLCWVYSTVILPPLVFLGLSIPHPQPLPTLTLTPRRRWKKKFDDSGGRCKFDFVGNPFEACTAESKEEIDDLCNAVHCGPNAVCNLGQCLCAPGFEGDNPNDPAVGCSAISKCTYDTDCGYNEVCALNQVSMLINTFLFVIDAPPNKACAFVHNNLKELSNICL